MTERLPLLRVHVTVREALLALTLAPFPLAWALAVETTVNVMLIDPPYGALTLQDPLFLPLPLLMLALADTWSFFKLLSESLTLRTLTYRPPRSRCA